MHCAAVYTKNTSKLSINESLELKKYYFFPQTLDRLLCAPEFSFESVPIGFVLRLVCVVLDGFSGSKLTSGFRVNLVTENVVIVMNQCGFDSDNFGSGWVVIQLRLFQKHKNTVFF